MLDIESIYNEYFLAVYKYLYSLCINSDLAEELTQETFYRAIKTLNSYRGDCKVSVWLCQIAKFCWYEEIRKRKKEEKIDDNILDNQMENLEEKLINIEDKKAIYKKINTLEEHTKKVMLYRITADMSFKEIGLIMGKTENWARVTYYRGKEKILKGVDQYE